MDAKLGSAVNAAAKIGNMDEEDFIEVIYRFPKRASEFVDVNTWMKDKDIFSDIICPEEILAEYYHYEDCNADYWNIIKTHMKGYVIVDIDIDAES